MDFGTDWPYGLAAIAGGVATWLVGRLRKKPAPAVPPVENVLPDLIEIPEPEPEIVPPAAPEPEPEPIAEPEPELAPVVETEEPEPVFVPSPSAPKPVGKVVRGCECGIPGHRCGIHNGRPIR